MVTETRLIVLAAGSGSRLQADIPKPLFPVKGIPTLSRIINVFSNFVDGVAVVVSPTNKNLITAAVEKVKPRVPVSYYTQQQQSGILDAVKLAASENIDSDCWLIWGDQPLYTESFISQAMSAFESKNSSILVPIFEKNDGYIEFCFAEDKLCCIKQAREGENVNVPSWADGGLFFFRKQALFECLEFEPRIEPGIVTGEANFLSLLVPMSNQRPSSILFHRCAGKHGQGFNTREELHELENLIDSIR